LPGRRLEQFLQGRSAGPLHQVQNLGGLATWEGVAGFSARLGALLGKSGLAYRPGLGGRSAAFLCGGSGLVGGLGFPAAVAVAWAGSRFSVVDIVMMHAPVAVITAVTTWITPKRSHCK
jgi:hypothetical protein